MRRPAWPAPRGRAFARWHVAAGLAVLAVACAPRYDVADLGLGLPPFDALRGIDMASVRVGHVRAFRHRAERRPGLGLRETAGDDILDWIVPGFDGADGSWPAEDVLIDAIDAWRVHPDDSAAARMASRHRTAVTAAAGAAPTCGEWRGVGAATPVAEWQRPGGYILEVSWRPAFRDVDDVLHPARSGIALRRTAAHARAPEVPAPAGDIAAGAAWHGTACPPNRASP